MVYMRYCFLLNPAAGKGAHVTELAPKIEAACAARGVPFEIYLTTGVGDATEYVTCTVASEPDEDYCFFACGGDGTLGEVVNGVMRLPDSRRVSVGVIPSGTGNDFVRNFDGKERFFDVEAQLEATPMTVDLLRCNELYAINMVNIGFDCEVVCKTAQLKTKKWIPSGLAYIAGLLVTLIRKPGVRMHLSCDGDDREERQFLLTTYANGCFCGGGFHSNPKSSPEDGLIDALFVNDVSRLKFLSLVGDYKKGTHLSPKFEKILRNEKLRELELTFDAPTNISVDGEVVQMSSLRLSVCPRALRFLVPSGAVLRQRAPETACEAQA